jgi:CheY-like chemotaxis protein
MLEMLPEAELPTLLLLDARTATRERLSTLHQLKASNKLRSIPVILFVLPTDQAVIDGYMHQANSVISAAPGHGLSDDILERICQFWLHMVQLPTAATNGRFAPVY